MDTLLIEHDGPVAVLRLNRPERLNAISNAMIVELSAAMRELNSSEQVRSAVLTGAGERAFCVGMDLKERAGMSEPELAAQRPQMYELFASIRHFSRPLIAAVNGHALGGGLEFALSCDFIYASTAATFGMPEVTRGIMPGAGATQLLPQRIGAARARELVYTGLPIDAGEAARIGLVNRVVPASELQAVALAAAQTIAANAPIGIRQAKRAMNFSQAIEEGIRFENEAYQQVLYSADRREGYAAFVEKRKAEYKGR
jgi:enoyl-CoA hydratase/carnithine racemase